MLLWLLCMSSNKYVQADLGHLPGNGIDKSSCIIMFTLRDNVNLFFFPIDDIIPINN